MLQQKTGMHAVGVRPGQTFDVAHENYDKIVTTSEIVLKLEDYTSKSFVEERAEIIELYIKLFAEKPWGEELTAEDADQRLRKQLENPASILIYGKADKEVIAIASAQLIPFDDAMERVAKSVVTYLNIKDIPLGYIIEDLKSEFRNNWKGPLPSHILICEEFGIAKQYRTIRNLIKFIGFYLKTISSLSENSPPFIMWTMEGTEMDGLSKSVGMERLGKLSGIESNGTKKNIIIYADVVSRMQQITKTVSDLKKAFLVHAVGQVFNKFDTSYLKQFLTRAFHLEKKES